MERFAIFAFGFLVLAACNPVAFNVDKSADNPVAATGPAITAATPAPGATPTPACGSVESIARLTKILFVVDTSGSNAELTYNYGGNCGASSCPTPATDPAKAFRGGAISDFLARYRHKSNFQWGFVTFANDSAHAFTNSGTDQSPQFAPDPNVMQFALNSFMSTRDQGNTPYHAALDMAARAIFNDPDLRSPLKPDYFVVLLTDGFPTDYYDSRGQFRSQAMGSDLSALLNVAPGQVSLSTIYYGQTNDPSAIQLLSGMAATGAGQFANVSTGGPNAGFKIDDVIPSTTSTCQ